MYHDTNTIKRELDEQIKILHGLAQQPASQAHMCREIDAYYQKIAEYSLWLHVQGRQEEVPFLQRDYIGLMCLSWRDARRFTGADGVVDNRPESLPESLVDTHVPLLPTPELGYDVGIAQRVAWLIPCGAQNAAGIMDRLPPRSRLLIGAAQVLTELPREGSPAD